jgi:hypothetical protein
MIKKLKLLKDIVIPAGTIFSDYADTEISYGDGCFITTIDLSKNSSGDLIYGIDTRDEEMGEWFKEEL